MKKSELTEENLEIFIKQHKDKFDKCDPSTYHGDHFFVKLLDKFKVIKTIVPHLWKVAVGVIVIWGISIALWWFFNWPTLWSLFYNWWNGL